MSAVCERCRSPIEPEDLRCAVCFLATPAGAAPAPERAHAQILRCESCGAALTYDPAVRAPHCAFCGSVVHLEQPADPIEHADHHLPFKVDPAAAQAALRAHLAKHTFLRPSGLAKAAAVDPPKGLWWVAWLVDADADVSWSADSDEGHGRSAWAPHAGEQHMRLADALVSASRGLTPEECVELAQHFDLSTTQDGAPPETGAIVERFDLQRSAARQHVIAAIERAATAEATAEWIPGRRSRKVHVAVLLRGLTTKRYALPSYVLAWRYRGKLHRAVVHGQDPNVVLGKVPLSPWKVAGFVAGIAAGVAAIAAVAIHLLAG